MFERTVAKPDPAGSGWTRDPLLLGKDTPRFLRVSWDEQRVDAFGPWRVGAPADPAVPAEAPPEAIADDAPPTADSPPEVTEVPAEPEAPAMAEVIELPAPVVPPGISEEEVERRVAEAWARGHEEGRAEGRDQALAETEAERARERELLRHLGIECKGLAEHPERLTEPLRRLALHLAEELVRAELHLSGQAVAELVEQVVAQLDGAEPVLVQLHPDDLLRLQALAGTVPAGMQWVADAELRPGSVRVRANDTVIEDLIENRLHTLAEQMLEAPQAWQARSERRWADVHRSSPDDDAVQDVEIKRQRSAMDGHGERP